MGFVYSDPMRGEDKRRVPIAERKTFVVSEMWERHHEIARRLALGQSNKHIAEALGVTPEMISTVKNSPVVQEKTASLRDRMDDSAVDVGKRIRDLAPKAMEVLESVLDDVDDTIPLMMKVKTAQDILDRAGHAAVRKIQGNVLHGHFDSNDLAEIKQLAIESGVIVDATYEER